MADLLKVMEREMLCSEHAAQCFLEAKRRDIARQKARRAAANSIAPEVIRDAGASEMRGHG